MWFKYGLKAQKLLEAARPERAEALSPGHRPGYNSNQQGALKGQKLLAQGIALGIIAISKAPCKGKSLINCPVFKAFALTGRQVCVHNNPGRCPGRALKKSLHGLC